MIVQLRRSTWPLAIQRSYGGRAGKSANSRVSGWSHCSVQFQISAGRIAAHLASNGQPSSGHNDPFVHLIAACNRLAPFMAWVYGRAVASFLINRFDADAVSPNKRRSETRIDMDLTGMGQPLSRRNNGDQWQPYAEPGNERLIHSPTASTRLYRFQIACNISRLSIMCHINAGATLRQHSPDGHARAALR